MGYGRQVSFRENPNRWNFKSDRDFRTLAATVYQSEVWACTPTNWYLKKRVLNGRVRWNVIFCRAQAQQAMDLVGTLTAIPERLSGCILGVAIAPVLRNYGNHCHQSTVNALSVTLIFVSAYERVLPKNRHRAVGKESGKMNRIERFNLTLRQWISRLVRKTLSFRSYLEFYSLL